MDYVVASILGYCLGSIPVAVLVARRERVDLRRRGDGNPGAWNALEALGARRAWLVFAGDGLKAGVPALVGLALGGWWVAWAGVAGAMVGHALPIWSRGRGGKAVMCFVGGAFVLSPVAALGCLGVCLAGVAAGRAGRLRDGAAWGSRVGVFGFPLAQLATDPVLHVLGTGGLMAFIGLLFLLRRGTRAPASAESGAAPTG